MRRENYEKSRQVVKKVEPDLETKKGYQLSNSKNNIIVTNFTRNTVTVDKNDFKIFQFFVSLF